VFNPSSLPIPLQKLLNYSYEQIDKVDIDLPSYAREREMVRELGLNWENAADRRLFADIIGFMGFGAINRLIGGRDVPIDPDNPDAGTFQTNSYRDVSTRNNKDIIQIENGYQATSSNGPKGFGYMQLARQLAAAREIARRTGKTVQINVGALNDFDVDDIDSEGNFAGGYGKLKVGLLVWPKMGYQFSFNEFAGIDIKNDLKRMGFTEEQLKDTATLMLSRTPSGLTGYDAWDKVLSREQYSNVSLMGRTEITPNDVANNQITLAERVTQEYGRRKGFLKSAIMETDTFTIDDNNTLREIWRELAREQR